MGTTYHSFQMDIINFDFHNIKLLSFKHIAIFSRIICLKKQSNIWDEIKIYGGSFKLKVSIVSTYLNI